MSNNKNTSRFLLIALTLILTGLACATLTGNGSDPQRTTEELFDGVTYIKEVRTSPRKMVVHIVKVDMTRPGVKPLVTPPDNPKDDKPYNARTTSQFARQNRVQLAINGGGFSPWYDYKLVYFPHTGDKVKPLGTVVYENYALNLEQDKFPLVLFGGKRPIDIGYIQENAQYAVSGLRMLVDDGQVVSGLNNWDKAPRTAVGNSQNGQTMIIVVIDGRQSGYSNGATLQELAKILLENGAYDAIDLDGGGSSTLVLNPRNEAARVLNSPIHNGVPGRERPVATHIGIFARE